MQELTKKGDEQFHEKKRISKYHFKEHQHNNLSHCIMSDKKLATKWKINDFEEKKNGEGS